MGDFKYNKIKFIVLKVYVCFEEIIDGIYIV